MTAAVFNAGGSAPTGAGAPAMPAAPKPTMDAAQLRRAAKDFEAFFLARALEPMFEGIGAEAPFGGGLAETMWRSLLVDEYGKAFARAGGIGLADAMVRDLLALQQAMPAPALSRTQAAPSTSAQDFTKSEMKHP